MESFPSLRLYEYFYFIFTKNAKKIKQLFMNQMVCAQYYKFRSLDGSCYRHSVIRKHH
ncbi:hypothetical protein B4110_0419 [Parageobacillus toebii]|uniref:Uncharacterized protein n=1 Tax=Parageobacillus toebii TaxID=153151 RepID=A0A150MAV8_9BACL|nr:hypothetical protein B4110_0419 [Parageobacillus toebii]